VCVCAGVCVCVCVCVFVRMYACACVCVCVFLVFKGVKHGCGWWFHHSSQPASPRSRSVSTLPMNLEYPLPTPSPSIQGRRPQYIFNYRWKIVRQGSYQGSNPPIGERSCSCLVFVCVCVLYFCLFVYFVVFWFLILRG
jgi:hypothetical protein